MVVAVVRGAGGTHFILGFRSMMGDISTFDPAISESAQNACCSLPCFRRTPLQRTRFSKTISGPLDCKDPPVLHCKEPPVFFDYIITGH